MPVDKNTCTKNMIAQLTFTRVSAIAGKYNHWIKQQPELDGDSFSIKITKGKAKD